MADQKKTYTVTTTTTPARPRSKARRDGTGLTSGGASAIIESATAGNAQRASHANTADEASHALRADEAARAATAKTAEHATTADRATAATTAERANTANTADTATRAQSAQTADHAATAARADQAQRATEAETLRTPNYSDGLTTGAGARIDATGNAEFQSMAVRGFFRAAEYQINRIALSEGDVFHTENGLVKSAARQADGRWKVVLQERFQGDVTGFRVGDILRGAYNGIGTSGGAAEIRTSWLRVEAVDAKAGTLTASLYADNQTPEGRNAPPVPLMRLARWGNTTDPERQSHIVESATDGRIVRRVKVSAPIVDGAQSDGFVVGKLPTWLREHFGAAVADASDYVFARGIITQNILRYTPAGRPLAERVDRGLWSTSARYFYEQQNPETGAFEISRVWHDGALYELARGGNGNTAPAAQSTHWTLIQAKPKDGSPGYDGKTAPPTNPNLLNFTAKWRDKEGNIPYQTEESRKAEANITTTNGGKYGTKCFRVQADPKAAPGNNGIYAFSVGKDLITGTLKAGQWYTYSFYVHGKGHIRSGFYFQMNPVVEKRTSVNGLSRGGIDYLYQPLSEEWQRVVCTFRVESGRVFPWFFSSLSESQSTDDWLEICCAKFEEGEDATPWCLSENDKIGADGRDGESYHANLLEDSAFKKGFDQWNQEGRFGVFDDTQTSPVPGTRVVRYDTAMLGDLPFSSIVQHVSGKLRPNTTYTLSVWVKTSQELKKATILFAFKPLKSLDISYQHGGEWTRCVITVTTFPEKNDNQSIRLRLNKQEGDASVWFAAPKLEIGDTPTEWTPSENDRKGEKGDNGRGVSRMRSYYMLTTERDAPQHDTSGWTETAPQPTKESPWLWSYERSEYTDGDADQTVVRLIGHYGKDGTNGTSIRAQYSADARTWHDDFAEGDVWMRTGNGTTWGGALRVVGESGADGKSPVYDFAASTQLATASGTTAPSIRGTWQDAPPTLREGEVLWYRLTAANGKITYGRLSGEKGTSIRAQYSADARTWHDDFAAGDVWMRTGNGTTWGGALRVVGESGADGKSPVYDFAASSQLATASGTTAPTIRGTWQDAPPTLRDGEVLWYRLTATNGKITYGRLSGEKGKTSYTHIAYANSADGAKDFTLEEDLGRGGEIEFSYFGIYADFDESASQDYPDYVWTRLRGVDGKDGLTPNANLLDDTDFKNLGRKESAWGVGTFGEEPLGGRANADLFPPSVSGCYPALCSINPGTKQGEFAQLWQNIGRLIPGRTYTFSVYVRGASDAWLIVHPNPSEHFRPNTVKPDEWTRVSLTFTVPKTKVTEDTLILLRAWHREEQPHKGFAKNVVWCAPKLEEGGVPTPWTPSRNDLRGNDGAPGARGAVVRQFGDYAKLPDGTAFESGHAGEQYVDVVQVRQGAQVQFYQCKQPHTKSADKVPAADSEWWELGMYQGFIATDLFLAKLSLIKNLQVENVVGRDANGNTTFDLDASTGTAYFGGTATFAGFIRRRPVVITPDNWKAYGGKLANGVIYLNPFHVGTYVIFRGNFGTLRPTINTGGAPLNDGEESATPDNSQAMRYYGAQFMVFNDLEPFPNTLLTVGGLTIGSKQTAIFTMLGHKKDDPTLWWKGEIVGSW